ncbi:MAG: nitrilase-related carbon-nitrogen hydrolase, partial [bacterium]|nr:nitrilase-related carbon-nitrogen hydrolase [bacterium]
MGLIQMRHGKDVKANFAAAKEKIFEAARLGAQIVSLSELFSSLYFCQSEEEKNFGLAETIPGPSTQTLCEWA